MSEELINRLQKEADYESNLWGKNCRSARLLREAADALSRPAPVQVPAGWKLVRDGDAIIVSKFGIGGCVVRRDATEAREIPETILWELASDMLAAAPSAPVAREYERGTLGHTLGISYKSPADGEFTTEAMRRLCDHLRGEGKPILADCLMGLAKQRDELKAAAPAVDAEKVSGWIPVGERLPEEEGSYLVLHKTGGVSVASFEAHFNRMAFTSYDGWTGTDDLTDSITHWQPLPPPPAIANQSCDCGQVGCVGKCVMGGPEAITNQEQQDGR